MENTRMPLACLLTFLLLSACTGDKSHDPVNSSYNLNAGSFNVSSTRDLSSSEFTGRLNSNDDFMQDDNSGTAMDSCLAGKIGNSAFIRNSDGTYWLSVPDTELKECYSNTSDRIYNSLVYSLFYDEVVAADSGGNLVDLEGKTLGDAWDFMVTQSLYRAMSTADATFTVTGTRYVATGMTSAHDLADFNGPCVNEGANNCRIEDVSKVQYIDNAAYNYNDKNVLDSHFLEIVPGAPYYANGTITFTFNNWNGTMTYGNNAYTAPTYTATNGSDSVTGTYTPLISPALKSGTIGEEVKRSIKEVIWKTSPGQREMQ